MPVQYNIKPPLPNALNPNKLGLSAEEVMQAISTFDLIGLWTLDLESGKLIWSDAMYQIYEWDREKLPSISAMLASYHEEDRDLITTCIEEASKQKTGFRYVLRLNAGSDNYRWVKSNGIFRKNAENKEELFGYIEKFSAVTKSVTIL